MNLVSIYLPLHDYNICAVGDSNDLSISLGSEGPHRHSIIGYTIRQ